MNPSLDELKRQLDETLAAYEAHPTPELRIKANRLRRQYAELDVQLNPTGAKK